MTAAEPAVPRKTRSLPHTVFLLVAAAGLLAAVGCVGSSSTLVEVKSAYPDVLHPATIDTVYAVDAVDERPEPQGGMRAVVRRMNYPKSAKDAGITGRVMAAFVVAPDAHATNVRVVDPVHPLLDDEARRVVRASPFSPGRLSGEAVPVRIELPLTFKQTRHLRR